MNGKDSRFSLPIVKIPSIPLSFVIERLVQRSFSALIDLSEELASASSIDRKQRLFNYCVDTRKQFIKLLALIKWISGNPNMMDYHFITQKEVSFDKAAESLFKLHGDMRLAKQPMYDVVSAIDVLSVGRYRRLPGVIRKTFGVLSEAAMTVPDNRQGVEMDTHQINHLIRLKLRHDVLPKSFRDSLKIDAGLVWFSVSQELEVALCPASVHLNDPWKIMQVKFAPTSEKAALNLTQEQLENIRQVAQLKLNQVKQSENEFITQLSGNLVSVVSESLPNDTMQMQVDPTVAQMSAAGASLLELFDFLQLILLKLKLKNLEYESKFLVNSKSTRLLLLDSDDESLVYGYWTRPDKQKAHAFKCSICIESQLNSDLIDRMGKLSRREMIAWSHVNTSMCNIYTRTLVYKYFDKEIQGFVSLGALQDQTLDEILTQVTQISACGLIDELSKICFETSNHDLLGSSLSLLQKQDVVHDTFRGVLDINYHPEWRLSVTVSLTDGQYLLSVFKTTAGFTLQETASRSLKELEHELNQDKSSIIKCISTLRYKTFTSSLESLSSIFNLKVTDLLSTPSNPSLLSKAFNVPSVLEHAVYCQFIEFPSFQLVFSVLPIQEPNVPLSIECKVKWLVWLVSFDRSKSLDYPLLTMFLPIPPHKVLQSTPGRDQLLPENIWDTISTNEMSNICSYCTRIVRFVKLCTQVRCIVGLDYKYLMRNQRLLRPEYVNFLELQLGSQSPLICVPARKLLKGFEDFKMEKITINERNLMQNITDSMQLACVNGMSHSKLPFSDVYLYLKQGKKPQLFGFIRLNPMVYQGTQEDSVQDERLTFSSTTGLLQACAPFEFDSVFSLFKLVQPILLLCKMAVETSLDSAFECRFHSLHCVSVKYDKWLLVKIIVDESNGKMFDLSVQVLEKSVPDPDGDSCPLAVSVFPISFEPTENKNFVNRHALNEAIVVPSQDTLDAELWAHVKEIACDLLSTTEVDALIKTVKWLSLILQLKSIPAKMKIISFKQLRLSIESWAFDVMFHSDYNWISVTDAHSTDPSNIPHTMPGFSQSISEPRNSSKPMYYSFISSIKSKSEDSTTKSTIHDAGHLVQLPNALVFEASMLPPITSMLKKHSKLVSVFSQLEIIANKYTLLGMEKVKAEMQTLRVAYMTNMMICTIGCSPKGHLYIKLKMKPNHVDAEQSNQWNSPMNQVPKNAEEPVPITATDLQAFESLLNEKLAFNSDFITVDWLEFLVKLSLLSKIMIRDLVQISQLEHKQSESLKLKWIIARDSEPCSSIDLESKRVCFNFEFSDSKSKVIFPLCYNYSSGVLNQLKKTIDDLTLIPSDSPFLQQKLAEISSQKPASHAHMIDRVLVAASTRSINARNGGPGKLFPTLKALCSRSLSELQG